MIPLTEETGIIEWVPHTHGLRHCCQDIYIADGTYDKRTVNMTVKKIYDGFQVQSHLIRHSHITEYTVLLYYKDTVYPCETVMYTSHCVAVSCRYSNI